MPLQPKLVDWLVRIEAEYREMPGLKLTARQMQRLWDLDGQTCTAIVQALTARGVLKETSSHTYALAAASRP
jgi:hypothetical protein